MKREFFNKQFSALLAAYTMSQKLPDEAQDVYWEMLRDIPDEKFGIAVKACLAQCKFFPTISELGEAALPTKRKLGPYNPYGESIIELDWRAQVEEIKEEAEALVEYNERKLLT